MFRLLILSFIFVIIKCDRCEDIICLQESGCKAIGCNMDEGSLSCGYFQIKLPYYIDCGTPGRNNGQSVEQAWKTCSDNYSCALSCMRNYFNRYKGGCAGLGKSYCEMLSRIHNGGPNGCTWSKTDVYWNAIKNRNGHHEF